MAKTGFKKKGKFIRLVEYAAVYLLIQCLSAISLRFAHLISSLAGSFFYLLVPKRRNISLQNLRNTFNGSKTEKELRRIARQSFKSFILTFIEVVRLRRLYASPDATDKIRDITEGLDVLFQKARKAHDESGGCIFVTPHIGNWEILPHVSALAGIPLVVVARPIDNEYLERLIYQKRAATGQIIIPKKNAFLVLQKTLNAGKSIGMLPDQSTMNGIVLDFLGRKATNTPVPALLSVIHKRPIVVVACCRKDRHNFEGFVCDPIWPGEYKSEKDEIFRLTAAMNRNMESIILKHPEQYLWMHNRWKTYEGKKEFLS